MGYGEERAAASRKTEQCIKAMRQDWLLQKLKRRKKSEKEKKG